MTRTGDDQNIVILAGGISSRMKKGSESPGGLPGVLGRDAVEKSKSMIGVGHGGRPFLDYLLFNIERAGYRDVCIVVGERDATLRNYYDNGGAAKFPSLTFSYAIQSIPPGREKPLGTADALLSALRLKTGWRGRSFTVCNSDNLYSVNVCELLRKSEYANALIDYDRTGLVFAEERIRQFAVIMKDADGYLLDIIEKPSDDQFLKFAGLNGRIGVSMNIFRLAYDDILPFLESIQLHPVRKEKELPIAVRNMAGKRPRSVMTIPVCEHVIDLTSQSDIPAVRRYLAEQFPDFNRQK